MTHWHTFIALDLSFLLIDEFSNGKSMVLINLALTRTSAPIFFPTYFGQSDKIFQHYMRYSRIELTVDYENICS